MSVEVLDAGRGRRLGALCPSSFSWRRPLSFWCCSCSIRCSAASAFPARLERTRQRPARSHVGLGNWLRLLEDQLFWRSLGNNLLLGFLSVLIQLPIALGFLADDARPGEPRLASAQDPLFPAAPDVERGPGRALQERRPQLPGPINAFLQFVHLEGLAQDWLGDTRFSLGAVIAVVCWQNIPFYMVLFLAGLSSFPAEIDEAARLDGASATTIFWRIRLPRMRGTIRTGGLLAFIGSLCATSTLIFIMTDGGPEGLPN